MCKLLSDKFKARIYQETTTRFESQELIGYMCKRLSMKKMETFSDIRYELWKKYSEYSDNELLEEKDRISLRKMAFENAAIENMLSTSLSAVAIFVALIALVVGSINPDFKTFVDIIVLLAFVSAYLATVLFLVRVHQNKMILRAEEIVYCTVALEVIKKVESERNIIEGRDKGGV